MIAVARGGSTAVGLGEQLVREVTSLASALRSPWTVLFGLVMIALILGAWWLRRRIQGDRRLTVRIRVMLGAVVTAGTLLAVAGACFWLLGVHAPLLQGLILATALVALAALAVGRGRAWGWALGAIVRGHIRSGDRLQVGNRSGVVESLGVFRFTILQDGDGSRLLIPTSQLVNQTIAISSPERAYPVEITIDLDREAGSGELAAAREIALVCPYRESRSRVEVTRSPEGDILVRFRSWSEEGSRLAVQYVRRAAARRLSEQR